ARPGLRATLFGAPPHFLVGRESGGFLGVVPGASGGALRPFTPGFPDPHRRTPTPRRPVAKETGIQKPTPCGVSLWPTLAACAWPLAPATAQAGPRTPGGALRPGPTGVRATSGPRVVGGTTT